MIVDIIIILIVLGSIFIGIKKGLISSIIDILSIAIAIILAIMLCKPISNMVVENTDIDENLKSTIEKNIPLNDTDFTVSEESNLPKPMIDYINSITEGANETKDDAIQALSTSLTSMIISVAVFIAIFVIVRIILAIIKLVSKIIDKIPGLKEVNKIGGAICGAIEGIILVYVILAILSMVSPLIAETKIIEQINESNIGMSMYNNNYILKSIYKK